MTNESDVKQALQTVVDPELGINIVDLGLVYEIAITNEMIQVDMTMTSAACPMHNLLSRLAADAVRKVAADGIAVKVDVVFDPPWNADMMSEAARKILG